MNVSTVGENRSKKHPKIGDGRTTPTLKGGGGNQCWGGGGKMERE